MRARRSLGFAFPLLFIAFGLPEAQQNTSPHDGRKKFREARKAAGLPASLVLYAARHTYGTFVYEATKNLQLVMNSMGHGDVRTTMRYQLHDHLEPVRNAIDQRNQERHNLRHSPLALQ
jgi:integrase